MKHDNQLVSPYKNNVTAKRSKLFFANLINYFICLIATFFFAIVAANPIVSSTPIVKQANEHSSQLSYQLYEIIGTFRIQEYNKETKTLTSISDMKKIYLTNLCKTSLFLNNKTYDRKEISFNETMFYVNNNSFPNDNLSYYYHVVKKNYPDLNSYVYQEVDYKDDINKMMYQALMGYNDSKFSGYFISDEEYNKLDEKYKVVPKYNILSLTYAQYLHDYLVFNTTGSIEEKTFNNLGESYLSISNYSKYEVETKYQPYIELNNQIFNEFRTITASYIVAYSIAYLITFIILYTLIPLINRNDYSDTLGFKILKLGYTDTEEFKPRWFNYLTNYISRFIIGYSCLLLCFFFTGLLKMTTVSFGYFNFLGLLLFTLVYGLLSNFFLVFSKKHQDFSSFIGQMYVKDKNEFEGPVVVEENGTSESEEQRKN